ncbi:hypothetical protein VMCG_06586 [Cytospora schulzeri]|uniref:Uncharacterized protein n=1 Tax=Cytospora schulzeri TaxID=448051 RepID=A0A423W6T5_9PEZI|nr:hypothetical protein VMCG_06586 [Valsa malicola]
MGISNTSSSSLNGPKSSSRLPNRSVLTSEAFILSSRRDAGTTSTTMVTQLRPRSHTLPGSTEGCWVPPGVSSRAACCRRERLSLRASSQTSVLASISNSGQRIVTLLANRPGVTEGVASVTLTDSKMGFLNVRRYCTGLSGASRAAGPDAEEGPVVMVPVGFPVMLCEREVACKGRMVMLGIRIRNRVFVTFASGLETMCRQTGQRFERLVRRRYGMGRSSSTKRDLPWRLGSQTFMGGCDAAWSVEAVSSQPERYSRSISLVSSRFASWRPSSGSKDSRMMLERDLAFLSPRIPAPVYRLMMRDKDPGEPMPSSPREVRPPFSDDSASCDW